MINLLKYGSVPSGVKSKKRKLFSSRQNVLNLSPLKEVDNNKSSTAFVQQAFTPGLEEAVEKKDTDEAVIGRSEHSLENAVESAGNCVNEEECCNNNEEKPGRKEGSKNKTIKKSERVQLKLKRKRKYESSASGNKMEESFELQVKKKKKKKRRVDFEEDEHIIKKLKKQIKKKKKRKKKEKEKIKKEASEENVVLCSDDNEPPIKDDKAKQRLKVFKKKANLAANEVKSNNAHGSPECIEILSEELKEKLALVDSDYTPKHMEHLDRIAALYQSNQGNEKHPLLLESNVTTVELRKASVKFASGSWTTTELHTLFQNIKHFKHKYQIKSFNEFFQNIDLSKCIGLETNYDVFIEIGENILRPLRSIRGQLELIYLKRNAQNCEGPYTEKEMERLISLQKRYGSDWKYISALMHRTPHSLSRKFADLVEAYNIQNKNADLTSISENLAVVSNRNKRTPFTAEEDKRIREAVKLYKKENGKINWKNVTNYVGGHRSRHIRTRWELTLQNRKPKSYSSRQFSEVNRYKLTIRCLRLLVTSNISDKRQINWDLVATGIKMNITEGIVVRAIFYNFVNKNVPNENDMSFEEILHHILNHKVHKGFNAKRRLSKRQKLKELAES